MLEHVTGTRERIGVVAEELRLVLRRRDRLSLEASTLAGELARAGFGEATARPPLDFAAPPRGPAAATAA
jgi:hypothetical protein